MIDWLIHQPILSGIITFLLMEADWLLTIAQEKERAEHYSEHYESYPINTVEGHPLSRIRESVSKRRLVSPIQLPFALSVGAIVSIVLTIVQPVLAQLIVGYVWGLYLIVDTQHLNNLMGYRASRKGLHGKLRMHLRTGYLVQSGRYFSVTILLLALSALSGSIVIYGVTIAGFVSSLRHLLWLKKAPRIEPEDVEIEGEQDIRNPGRV